MQAVDGLPQDMETPNPHLPRTRNMEKTNPDSELRQTCLAFWDGEHMLQDAVGAPLSGRRTGLA